MKRVIIYCMPFWLLMATSCTDFLSYKDKDKIVPTTLQNFSELAYTELMANSNYGEADYLNVMTDDLESYVTTRVANGSDYDSREIYTYHYIWGTETQYTIFNKEREDQSWNTIYRRILLANVIEDKLNGMDDDIQGVRERLYGELKFIRAMSYFTLINLYAAPYSDDATAKTQLAVPINTSSSIDTKMYTRAKMDEVCGLIEQNLLESIDHFKKGEHRNTIFRPNIDAARLYLTRYYLYTKQWQKVVDIANLFFAETKHSMMTMANMPIYAGDRGVLNNSNPGVIFTWGLAKGLDYATSGDNTVNNRGRFITSADLLSKYNDSDIRKNTFFKEAQFLKYLPFKSDPFTSNKLIYTNTIRIEEVYLNRAEAYIALGNISDAVADINTLRKERVTLNPIVTASDATTATVLLRDEKRREFCFEGLRWFDIRRWNLSITHVYHNFADPNFVAIFRLAAGSPNYIMPLPLNLVRKNPDIEQFTRVNCQVNL